MRKIIRVPLVPHAGTPVRFESPKLPRHRKLRRARADKNGDLDLFYEVRPDDHDVQDARYKLVEIAEVWDAAVWHYAGTFTAGGVVWVLLEGNHPLLGT